MHYEDVKNKWELALLSEDFTLTLLNRYEGQLSPSGTFESYSLEGNVVAQNASTTKLLKELTIFLAIPDKNIITEVKFEGLTPGNTLEKELMSVRLNPKDAPPPVMVTETISSGGKLDEDYRVLYPQRDNKISIMLIVKNQGIGVVPKIRITKNVEILSNLQRNQIKVDFGKFTLENNVLTWDIDDLKPGQPVTLIIFGKIVFGIKDTPINPWTSFVYNIPARKESKSLWIIKKIESEIQPKISEQVLYDLAISESAFEVAKIDSSRSILSAEFTSPDEIQLQVESVLKNTGIASLNDVEIIHQFPRVVQLPNPSVVSLTLQGTQISKSIIEIVQSPSENIPDCNVFRILIRDFKNSFGGFKAGEELRATFPVTLNKTMVDGALKYPTFFNVLVRPNEPLLESTVTTYSIPTEGAKRTGDGAAIKPSGAKMSFEEEEISKFSKLAVDAYNERRYEDVLAYCEQVSSVAQKMEDKKKVENLTKIITKLRTTIPQKTQEKGKGNPVPAPGKT